MKSEGAHETRFQVSGSRFDLKEEGDSGRTALRVEVVLEAEDCSAAQEWVRQINGALHQHITRASEQDQLQVSMQDAIGSTSNHSAPADVVADDFSPMTNP